MAFRETVQARRSRGPRVIVEDSSLVEREWSRG
jgi:hypothetical protein